MKFRRSKERSEPAEPTPVDDASVETDELTAERPRGPWDRSESHADDSAEGYVDLGGLVVRGRTGLELRLQVDDATQTVAAVMLAGPESGLELRAFAAPRSGGSWEDIRHNIAGEAARRGGTATELDGEFGTELKLVVPVTTPDGRHGTQTSRVVGVEGPRWLLRGTFLGKSAEAPDPDGLVESAFRDVIVVRGDQPMPPRAMIPIRMPPNAVEQSAGAAEADVQESSES